MTPEGGPGGSSQPGGGWIRRLAGYLGRHRRDVLLAFGGAVVGLTGTALTPVVVKVIVDDVVLARERPLLPWVALLLVIGLIRFGTAHVRRYVGGRVAFAVQYDLRNAIFEHLQRLDFARHDEFQTGQLVSRSISDVSLVQGLLSVIPLFTGNVVLLVASLIIMSILSPLLTVVALLMVPVIVAVALRLRTRVFPAAWHAQQEAAEVAGVVEEAVSGVRVVKAFGQEDQELERLRGTAESLYASRVRAVRVQAGFASGLQSIPALGQVAVLALGGWLALRGRISLGTFLAFSSYLLQLVSPARMLSILTVATQQGRAGAERIFELLDSTPVVVEREDATDLPPMGGEIRFEGATFGYLRSEPVLDGFDLVIRPGETVALVGPSGSGKSTVALLLPRFYDVQGGRVCVDGVDVRDVTLDSLRHQIGVVFEETFLFSDTIRANIAYGRPDATDEEVEAAARAAEAHAFIAALPDGYHTHLGEGGLTLSGGQRQRLALARALITDPRVLVLDDATSAVDSRVEEEIHATLRRLLAGRTTVLVAHRRSTLRLADRIAVVDGGRVIDTGTHEELAERCPLYRLLLAGPGSDEKRLAAGEVADPAGDGAGEIDPATGVTPSAWREPEGGRPRGRASMFAPSGEGGLGLFSMGISFRGSHGAGGGMAAMGMGHSTRQLGNAAETPQLRAALDALPPATDQPDVDAPRETRPDPDFRLGSFLRPYRGALGLGLGLVVLDALAALSGPWLVRAGIDRGVVGGAESALWVMVGVFLAVTLADWLVVWAQQRQTGRTAERLLYALRLRIFAHLQRLGIDFYEREMGGVVMTRMTTDVEALSQLLQQGLVNAVVAACTLTGVAIVLVAMNVPLSLATLASLAPLIVATRWFRRRSDAAYELARERVGAVNATLQEGVSGVRVAQAYGREGRNMVDFQRVARGHFEARLGAQRLVATYFPFVEMLSVVASALVLSVAYHLVDGGGLSPGELVAFMLYLNLLFSPIQQLSHVFDTYQQARASTLKIRELLATEPSVPVPASPVDPGRLDGELRFEGVRFRYPGAFADALSGIDLHVPAGQTVALVGETGAGKSTIVKLAARFYDPTDGRVLVDGHPLTTLDPSTYRRQLGYVPQEPFLFSGSIRDNIAYGRPEATDAEVEAAARAVGAHAFISSLPNGYLHPVAERGRSLAAGQRQLIALARALLVDPAVLLLDEATATLDLATEARVVRAMGHVSSGRTTLVIAHRLQTAMTADVIVVVDGGRIVESGPHADLIAAGGSYARLWEASGAGVAA